LNAPESSYAKPFSIVFSNDSPEKRYALQVVGRRVEIMELDDWVGSSRIQAANIESTWK